MPDLNDYHAYKSTNGGDKNNGSSGGGQSFGCGWVVIVLVAFLLLFFIADGASWEAIDCLLGFGLLAFILAKFLFR